MFGGILVAFVPASAEAAHPVVTLEMEGCEIAQPEEVRRIARIELGGLLIDETASSIAAHVFVHCTEDRVDLRIDDPVTAKALTRSLDWSGAAEAGRSRLVALAIAEIVSASWTELESTNPTPDVTARAPVAASPETKPVATRASSLRIMLIGEVRNWLREPNFAFGGGVRIERNISTSLAWSLDVLGDHGEKSVALGNISLDALSFGASLMFHREWAPLTLHSGPGLRVGAARISGEPISGAVHGNAITGIWGGPFAAGRASLSLSKRFALGVGVEGGIGLLDVIGRTDGIRAVTVGGPWLAASLSAELSL